jgi:signal peptidase I
MRFGSRSEFKPIIYQPLEKKPGSTMGASHTSVSGKGGKQPSSGEKAVSRGVSPTQRQSQKAEYPRSNWLREVAEAISIALILAFLFRAFEAEAFVIPTGSMAPTLMGRHKDLTCEQCGFAFQTGASEEVDKLTNRRTGTYVVSATCPNCRYTMYVGPNKRNGRQTPSYKGDRILVSKYEYHLSQPRRWDVIVFKYPGDASTNFIKRLVGLPNETVRIYHGDIFIRRENESGFSIARKPPAKILAMLQPVYDDDHPPKKLLEAGWPERWQAEEQQEDMWKTSRQTREYTVTATSGQEAWLRYRHFVPSWEVWDMVNQGLPVVSRQVQPQLISDFMAYNTNQGEDAEELRNALAQSVIPPRGEQLGLHWVNDLAVECEAEVAPPGAEIIFELTRGGQVFRARVDFAAGRATFEGVGDPRFVETVSLSRQGPGRYKIRFANVDQQLVLWVNERPVTVEYETDWHGPTVSDLERPVRIGVRQGTVTLRHLKVYRDVYYIAHERGSGFVMHDFDWDQSPYRYLGRGFFSPDEFRKKVAEVMSDPSQWDFFNTGHALEFSLGPKQYFVLGDNSPQSEDGRFWTKEHYVREELLVGKALAVIWPHSLDRIPGTNIPIRFFPNFWRMKIVR